MLRVACLQNLDNKNNKPLKRRTERRETVSGGYHLRLADSERTASAEDRTKQKMMRKVLKSKSAFRPGLLDLFLALFRCCNGGVWWRDRSAEIMPAVGGHWSDRFDELRIFVHLLACAGHCLRSQHDCI